MKVIAFFTCEEVIERSRGEFDLKSVCIERVIARGFPAIARFWIFGILRKEAEAEDGMILTLRVIGKDGAEAAQSEVSLRIIRADDKYWLRTEFTISVFRADRYSIYLLDPAGAVLASVPLLLEEGAPPGAAGRLN